MIKYTPASQLTLATFTTPFEKHLDKTNRWIKLAKLIPWDELASEYAKQLNRYKGKCSVDIRTVIAAIIVKHFLGLDDRGTTAMISENVYLQYFCGLASFQVKAPFDPSLFVKIRKRMSLMSFDEWNQSIIKVCDGLLPPHKRLIYSPPKGTNNQTSNILKDNDKQKDDKQESADEDSKKEESPSAPENKGLLKIDASVADQKIVYPTDGGLLNTCRLESERLIDLLYAKSDLTKKPRTYRRVAQKLSLAFLKQKNKSRAKIRRYIKKQLNYLIRDFKYINRLLNRLTTLKQQQAKDGGLKINSDKFPLPYRDQKIYWVIQQVYEQQKQMWEEGSKSVADRIVSIYQPYVRPIPRGKAKGKTEFGAKISASETNGMFRIEHLSWDAFNETVDLILQVEKYFDFYGRYPEYVLADRIYQTWANRLYCKGKGIKMIGKPLGRPPKVGLSAYQKRKQKKIANQRNLIEGKFGQGKNAYNLNKIEAKRTDTSESWIGAIGFVMNIVRLLKQKNQIDKLALKKAARRAK